MKAKRELCDDVPFSAGDQDRASSAAITILLRSVKYIVLYPRCGSLKISKKHNRILAILGERKIA